MILIAGLSWWLTLAPASDSPAPGSDAPEPLPRHDPRTRTEAILRCRSRRGQPNRQTGTRRGRPPRCPTITHDCAPRRITSQFAADTIERARQGDPSAQYYLSSALTYCESLYDWYFIVHQSDGTVRHRTLDEALQLTASRPVFTPDDVRDIQQRCQKLRKTQPPPFGSSREWLDAAVAAGFPLAQASAALNLALQGYERSDPDKARTARAAAREMAIDSLRTRDPRVMAQMGDVAANLAMDNPAEARKVQWVWPLAACLREANCESMTEWIRLFCNIDTQCQPFETPIDVIRRQAGNDYDEVERRARELNQKIDAGTLDEAICDAAGGAGYFAGVSFSSRPPLPLR